MRTPEAVGTLEGIGQQDHSVTCEYRIFGPPGAGKTTNLTRQIRRAVEKFGPDAVLVTSFSRAAAAELAGRDLPIRPDRIGTLHSLCWHALGGPEIAEASVEEWNREHPHLKITPVRKQGRLDGEESIEEEGDSGKEGDRLLQKLNRYRGLMIDRALWPPMLREFDKKWTEHKRAFGVLDFADLIETCLRDMALAPKNPAVIFADEAQDLNKMQLALIRKWGGRANYFILAGDDDQTIYSFIGASPEAMLEPDIPEDHKIILKQSYRVPRAVHAVADRFVEQVSRRQQKVYLPRPADGKVERLSRDGYKSPEFFLVPSALEHLERGKTVMFLAACSYMLQPVAAVLRKEGIPFYNPYRKANGFWNPIRLGKRGSSANRLLALLGAQGGLGQPRRPWTFGEIALWTECLRSRGLLREGAKKKLQTHEADRAATLEALDELFEPTALESLLAAYERDYCALLGWWQERLTAEVSRRIQYPAQVVRRGGPEL